MKKIISILSISLLALGLVACGDTSQNKTPDESPAVEESNKENLHEDESELKEWVDDAELHSSDTETKISSSEECSMKLLINEKEIPVIWENNDSVTEIMEESEAEVTELLSNGDVSVRLTNTRN